MTRKSRPVSQQPARIRSASLAVIVGYPMLVALICIGLAFAVRP